MYDLNVTNRVTTTMDANDPTIVAQAEVILGSLKWAVLASSYGVIELHSDKIATAIVTTGRVDVLYRLPVDERVTILKEFKRTALRLALSTPSNTTVLTDKDVLELYNTYNRSDSVTSVALILSVYDPRVLTAMMLLDHVPFLNVAVQLHLAIIDSLNGWSEVAISAATPDTPSPFYALFGPNVSSLVGAYMDTVPLLGGYLETGIELTPVDATDVGRHAVVLLSSSLMGV